MLVNFIVKLEIPFKRSCDCQTCGPPIPDRFWNLEMLVLNWGRKTGEHGSPGEKPLEQERDQPASNSTQIRLRRVRDPRIRTWAILVVRSISRHCTIPALQPVSFDKTDVLHVVACYFSTFFLSTFSSLGARCFTCNRTSLQCRRI